MKLTAYTCVLVFIGFAICQGTLARKLEILPVEENRANFDLNKRELYLQEGEELKLKCLGEGVLKFSTQSLTGNVRQSESETLMESGTYTFVRPNVIKEDTGWYGCAEKDTAIKNDEQTIDHPSEKISWIYVYVKPEDLSKNPFSVMDRGEFDTIISGITNGRVVIPCRPTDQNSPVTLHKDYNDEPVPVEGNVSYDPRIGFIITRVTGEYHEIPFECRVDRVFIGTPSYKLNIKAARGVSNSHVKVEKLRHMVLGGTLTLSCSVTMLVGTDIKLSWTTPDSVPEARLSQSSDTQFPPGEETHWRYLTIRKVEKTDTGEYICHANTSIDHAQSSTMVKIFAIT